MSWMSDDVSSSSHTRRRVPSLGHVNGKISGLSSRTIGYVGTPHGVGNQFPKAALGFATRGLYAEI